MNIWYVQKLIFEFSLINSNINTFNTSIKKKRKHRKSKTDKNTKSVDLDIFDENFSLLDKIKISINRCYFSRFSGLRKFTFRNIKCIRNFITFNLMEPDQINACQIAAKRGDTSAISALLLNSLLNTISNMANIIVNLNDKVTILDKRLSKIWDADGKQIAYLLTKESPKASLEEKSINSLKSDVNIKINKDAWINSEIDELKETKDTKEVEMKDSTIEANSKVKMNEIKNNIIARMNEVELLKKKNFCRNCGMIAHKMITDCPKRCLRCKGNHDTKVCAKNKLCNWCGNALGHNTACNKSNANFVRRSIKCPLCGLIGHFAEECRIKFIALGNVKFILNKIMKILSRNGNRFVPNANFKRRQRRFRRPRKYARK